MNDPIVERVEAVETLLVEKGIHDPAIVDKIIEHYETNVGRFNGAKVVARAGPIRRIGNDCSPMQRARSPSSVLVVPRAS